MQADIIGAAAAVLTTASFLPQAIRVIRTSDTAAISLWMYALFVTGVVLWGIYGALLKSAPIIAANLVTLALALIILVQKVRHVRAARKRAGG